MMEFKVGLPVDNSDLRYELRALREALTDIKYDKPIGKPIAMSSLSMQRSRDVRYDMREIEKISLVINSMEEGVKESFGSYYDTKFEETELVGQEETPDKDQNELLKLRLENSKLRERIKRLSANKRKTPKQRSVTPKEQRDNTKRLRRNLTQRIPPKKLKHCTQCDSYLSRGYSTFNCNKHGKLI